MNAAKGTAGVWRVWLAAMSASACSASAGGVHPIDAATGDATSADARAGVGSSTNDAALSDGAQGETDSFTMDDAPSRCSLSTEGSGVCNDVVLEGSVVTPTCVAGEPPVPEGGTIADGIYVLQSVALYGGCPDEGSFVTTWSICEGQWQVVQNGLDGGVAVVRVNFTADVSATSVTLTAMCSASINEGTSSRGYSASGSQLQFFEDVEGATSVGTYQRQ